MFSWFTEPFRENLEKLRELGEKLETESRLLKDSGVCEETEGLENLGDFKSASCDSSESDEPMDIVQEDDANESSTDEKTISDLSDISPEEKRAELYREQNKSEEESENSNASSSSSCDNTSAVDSELANENTSVNNSGEDRSSSEEDSGKCSTETDHSETSQSQPSVGNIELDDSNNGTCDSISDDLESDSQSTEQTKSNTVHIHLDSNVDSEFSSFNYWRTPLPEVDVDFEIVDGKPTNFHITAKVHDQDRHKTYATEMNVTLASDSDDSASTISDSLSDIHLDGSRNAAQTVISTSEKTLDESGELLYRYGVILYCTHDSDLAVVFGNLTRSHTPTNSFLDTVRVFVMN